MYEVLFSSVKPTKKKYSDSLELEELILTFLKEENDLLDLSIQDIIDIFDQLSKHWQSKDSELYDVFMKHNLGFLISWLKKKNISNILNSSLKDLRILDGPEFIGNTKIYAAPKGLVVHWIAGNVPILGVLSLFQGLMAKNKSIVKVPATFKKILPLILNDIRDKTFNVNQKIISGKKITNSVLIVYVDKLDKESQSVLSKYADVRYAWGGKEAIESIIGLEKKVDCEDLIMGPKTSLSVISKDYLADKKSIEDITAKITRDVFAFDQQGCNAPHNIYLEEINKNDIYNFAKKLAEKFSSEANKRSNLEKMPMDSFKILSERVLYGISNDKDVIFDDNYEFTIFIDYENSLSSSPLYNRSVYIKSINNIDDIPKLLPTGIQSIGIAIPKERIDFFAKKAARYGALRITNIGSMSLYDTPWDGIFPLSRLVNWVSVPS